MADGSKFQLRGALVLVTGGARRVGRGIVEALARADARVLIHANRSGVDALALLEEVRQAGGGGAVEVADLSCHEDLMRLADAIGPRGVHPVNAIVHAASPYERIPLDRLAMADLDRYYAVHLRAPVALAQAMAARLRETGGQGRIVHITDAGLKRPYGGFAAYFSTKSALDGLTRALAMELAPQILVNNVAPGTVLPPEGSGPEYVAARARQSPLNTVGSPDDVARAVLFLLTDPGFITGSTLTVDGGACMG